jgi:biotin/methionine sulfoxide reductase
VLFEDFRADPDKHRLRTPSGRIELYSELIAGFGYDDCPPYPAWIEPAEWLGGKQAARFPLHLVSSQPRHKLHSQMDAGPVSALGKVAGREALAINPVDARVRGIEEGEVVRVFNARGACFAGAVITEAVRAGCGAAVLRRLVRSGERGRRRRLRARQRQCADARSRHLAA